MLDADDRDAASVHHQLARVGGPDAHHQADIEVEIGRQHGGRRIQGVLGDLLEVHGLDQAHEVAAVGGERRPHDVGGGG